MCWSSPERTHVSRIYSLFHIMYKHEKKNDILGYLIDYILISLKSFLRSFLKCVSIVMVGCPTVSEGSSSAGSGSGVFCLNLNNESDHKPEQSASLECFTQHQTFLCHSVHSRKCAEHKHVDTDRT